MPKLIAHGAEAKIILSNNFVIKDRIKKSYRIKELDEKIRKLRTRSETKLLNKASKIINCPIPQDSKETNKINIPFIDGKKLSEHLDKFPLAKQKQICRQIGESVAKLHDTNIIHGDLTTSNMILSTPPTTLTPPQKNLPVHSCSQQENNSINKNSKRSSLTKTSILQKLEFQRFLISESGTESSISERSEPIIFFIDFGLGFISHKFEDKAVDLHLLRQALEAKHFKHWEVLFNKIVKSYKKSKDSKKVFERLKAVEKRGRYKS